MRNPLAIFFTILAFLSIAGFGYYAIAAADHWQFVVEGGSLGLLPPAPATKIHAQKMENMWVIIFIVDGLLGIAFLAIALFKVIRKVTKNTRGFDVVQR